MRRGSVTLVGLLIAAAVLSACSLTRQTTQTTGTPTGQASPTATSPAAGTGTPGTGRSPSVLGSVVPSSPGGPTSAPPTSVRLSLGDATTVRGWSPKRHVTGDIRIRVIKIDRADWSYFHGWQVPKATRHGDRPYFIHAKVANVGHTDLGGFRVPLFAYDNKEELVQASTFGSGRVAFQPCHPDVLPEHFRGGHTLRACLVMLVPGGRRILGASFRPHQASEPIIWTGPVRHLSPLKHH